jgi:hypothetical protein
MADEVRNGYGYVSEGRVVKKRRPAGSRCLTRPDLLQEAQAIPPGDGTSLDERQIMLLVRLEPSERHSNSPFSLHQKFGWLTWVIGRASSVYNSRGEFYAKYKRFTTVSKHLIDELGIPRECVPRSLSERAWNGNQARLLLEEQEKARRPSTVAQFIPENQFQPESATGGMAFDGAGGYEAQGGRLATTKAGFATYDEPQTTKHESNNEDTLDLDSSFAQPGITIDPAILHSASAQLTPDIPIISIEEPQNKHLATAHHTLKPTKNNSLPPPKTIFVATCAALNDTNAMSSINPEFTQGPLIGTFEFFPTNINLAKVSRYFESQFGLDNPPSGARRLWIKKFVLREDEDGGRTRSYDVTENNWETEILKKILEGDRKRVYLEFGIGFVD